MYLVLVCIEAAQRALPLDDAAQFLHLARLLVQPAVFVLGQQGAWGACCGSLAACTALHSGLMLRRCVLLHVPQC
jgi:hypothetical protein